MHLPSDAVKSEFHNSRLTQQEYEEGKEPRSDEQITVMNLLLVAANPYKGPRCFQ
jgi:hypothetical protein